MAGNEGKDEEEMILEVNPLHLSYMSIIGEGTTAIVHLAKYKRKVDGEDVEDVVAVKEIRASAECDEGTLQAVEREIGALSQVKHNNIVGFIGITISALPIRLVLEYCAGGSLFDLLHNSWNIKLCWSQKVKMLSDVASALDYLHNFDPPILHRDLKSLNMMLLEEVKNESSPVIVKLGDFGFARILEERSMTRGVGTKHWMAPEVHTGTVYTEKADIFSLAMAAFEIIARQVPFEMLDPYSVANQLAKGNRPDMDDMPPDVPDGLQELVETCWAHDPKQRPSIGDVRAQIQSVEQALEKA